MARPHKALRDQTMIETRQRLLDAAAVEFGSEGYSGANINRISTAAGFGKGTVYNHFDSKRALLLALIDEVAAAHVQAIITPVEQAADPVGRLERFFRAGFAFVEQHPERARVMINLIYGPNEDIKQYIYRAYEPLFGLLIDGIIGVGIEQGVFRPADPGVTSALIMTIYLGSCSLTTPSGKVQLETTQIMSFILEGILRAQPAGDVTHEPDHLLAQG